MKSSTRRIIIPILAALVVAGLIVGFLWWQMNLSTERVQKELKNVTKIIQQIGSNTPTLEPVIAGDRALLHLRKGDLAALQGDWAIAEMEYQESVDANGGLPALRKLAQAQLQRRNFDALNATIRSLKQEGAKPEDILLLQSIVLLRTGELENARNLLLAADESPQKHYGQALLAVIQSNHEQAQVELLAVRGGWDPVLRTYAETLQKAYDEYAIFPASPESHRASLLARALAEVQECELALPLLTTVIAQQEDYRDAWVVQGYCELVTERTAQALNSFEHAYSLDPEKPEIQYFLGRTHAALGDHVNALTFLQYALRNGFKPESEVRRLIASEALEDGNSALALEQYAALIDSPAADIMTYEKYIAIALALGQKDAALEKASAAVDKWPDIASAHDLLGWALLENDRKDEARTALEKALELDPTLESAQEHMKQL